MKSEHNLVLVFIKEPLIQKDNINVTNKIHTILSELY